MEKLLSFEDVGHICLADVLLVHLHFEKDVANPRTYVVLAKDLQKFIDASVHLHFSPGVNPSTLQNTARINRISASSMTKANRFWWTTPSLDNDGSGALIIDDSFRDVWVSPQLQAEYDRRE